MGSQRLSLRRNFGWTLVASVLSSAAKGAILIGLTKLTNPETVGEFALALAVATPITMLSQLQLRGALTTDAGNEHAFGSYYALRILCVVVALLLILAVARGAYADTAVLIAVIGASQAATSLRDIWAALAQKHERMDICARGDIIDALAATALFFGFLVASGSLVWATIGIVAGRALTLILYDLPRVRTAVGAAVATVPVWEFGRLRRLFWVALPLGLTTALISLNSNLPRYFIESWLGADALGYFAPIAYFVVLGRLFIGSLTRAASPRLAILYRRDHAAYGALVAKLVLCGVVLGAFTALIPTVIGESLLRSLYSAEYARYNHILVLIMVANGILFVNSLFGVAISAARYFKVQTVTYGAVVVTTLIACIVMIPRWGLCGAAWAVVVAAGVNTAINSSVFLYIYQKRSRRPSVITDAKSSGIDSQA